MFITQGNSDLKSEKSHSFDLSYSNFGAKFNVNLSLRHSFNNNSIENISRLITEPGGEMFDDNPEHVAPEGDFVQYVCQYRKEPEYGIELLP